MVSISSDYRPYDARNNGTICGDTRSSASGQVVRPVGPLEHETLRRTVSKMLSDESMTGTLTARSGAGEDDTNK